MTAFPVFSASTLTTYISTNGNDGTYTPYTDYLTNWGYSIRTDILRIGSYNSNDYSLNIDLGEVDPSKCYVNKFEFDIQYYLTSQKSGSRSSGEKWYYNTEYGSMLDWTATYGTYSGGLMNVKLTLTFGSLLFPYGAIVDGKINIVGPDAAGNSPKLS